MEQRRTVQLKVAGQSYRVTSSSDEDELQRLAANVEQKASELTPPGKGLAPQAILLAAMAFAHDAEEEREKRLQLERQTRDLLRRVLFRIDAALDENAVEPSPASP